MAKFKNIKRLVKRIIYTNLISENQLYLTPLLSGQHGIGKSMIIKQLADEIKGTMMVIDGGQLKEGEITGLPLQYQDRDGKISFRFLPYYLVERIQEQEKQIYLKRHKDAPVLDCLLGAENQYQDNNLSPEEKMNLLSTGEIKPVILYFDEIDRSDTQVYKELMNLLLNHRVNGYVFPWWVFFVAAMNPPTDDGLYFTNDIDPAQLDRFFKLDIAPTSTDFIAYAKEKDFSPLIPDFIKENRTALYQQKDLSNTECVPEPTPRGYEMLDLIFKGLDKLSPMFLPEEMTMKVILEDLSELCMSKLGKTTGTLFFDYVKNTLYNVTLDQFLNDDNELSHTKDKLKLMKSDMAEALGVNIISYLKDFAGSLSTNWRKLFELESKIGIFIKTIDKKTRIVFAHQFEDATTRQNQSFVSTYHDIYYHVIQPVFSQEKELKASYKKLK